MGAIIDVISMPPMGIAFPPIGMKVLFAWGIIGTIGIIGTVAMLMG